MSQKAKKTPRPSQITNGLAHSFDVAMNLNKPVQTELKSEGFIHHDPEQDGKKKKPILFSGLVAPLDLALNAHLPADAGLKKPTEDFAGSIKRRFSGKDKKDRKERDSSSREYSSSFSSKNGSKSSTPDKRPASDSFKSSVTSDSWKTFSSSSSNSSSKDETMTKSKKSVLEALVPAMDIAMDINTSASVCVDTLERNATMKPVVPPKTKFDIDGEKTTSMKRKISITRGLAPAMNVAVKVNTNVYETQPSDEGSVEVPLPESGQPLLFNRALSEPAEAHLEIKLDKKPPIKPPGKNKKSSTLPTHREGCESPIFKNYTDSPACTPSATPSTTPLTTPSTTPHASPRARRRRVSLGSMSRDRKVTKVI